MAKFVFKIATVIIIVCVLSGLANAQYDKKTLKRHTKDIQYTIDKNTVLVSQDTIFNVGKPYGIITKPIQLSNNHNVKSLNGVPVFFITDEGASHSSSTLKFLDGSNRLASIPPVMGKDRLAKFIVSEDLLTNDGINESIISVFLTKYPYRERRSFIEAVVEDVNSAIDNSKINRNRKLKVNENGMYLFQGDYMIGTHSKESEKNGNPPKHIIYIFHTDGTLCAKAIYSIGHREVTIITTRDNKTHNVVEYGVVSAADIAKYLVQWMYL